MKQFLNNRKGRILLFMLLAMFAAGASPAWADDFTESFEEWTTDGVADGWLLINGATYGNSYSYDYVVGSDDFTPSAGTKCLANSSHSAAQGTTESPMIVTPAMTGTLTFKFRKYNSSSSTKGYVNIFEYDETAGTATGSSLWTCKPNGVNEATSKYQTASITIGETPKRYAIYLAKVSIDEMSYTPTATVGQTGLQVFDDTKAVVSPYSYDFGLAEAGMTKEFRLHNLDKSNALGVSVAETGNFGAALSSQTIAAGGDVTLTVTMPSATGKSVVTVTPAEGEPFELNVSGSVKEDGKFFFDFSDESHSWPADWTADEGWTLADGVVSVDEESTVVSGRIKVAAGGEPIFFRHYTTTYNGNTADYAYVKVAYATTGNGADANWTQLDVIAASYQSWGASSVMIPATAKYLKITARRVQIDDFYGLAADEATSFATLNFTPADLDFGLISETTTSETYTITNSGNAELTGLSITSSNPAVFSISLADNVTTIAAGGSATFTVTMAATAAGVHKGVVTVSADGFEGESAVQFNVTGCVQDPDAFVVDFEDGQLPAGWAHGQVAWKFENGVAQAQNLNRISSVMTTPKLKFAEGSFFIVKANAKYNNDYITIEGSDDDGATYEAFKKTFTLSPTENWQTLIVSDVPVTVNRLRFESNYCSVDEIAGLAYAPELQVTDKDGQAVASPVAYDFGEQGVDATVSYTFKNIGTGSIDITKVETTGGYTTNWTTAVSVTDNTPFTLVITQPYDEANPGDKSGMVTVTTTDGTFVFNLTGKTMEANNPKMTVWIGEEEQVTGTALDFGMTKAGTAKTFGIKNSGTGVLSISNIAVPTGFTLKNGNADVSYPLTVGKDETAVLTLAITGVGKHSGNLVVTAEGQDNFFFTVSGYVLDETKMTANFDDNQLPDGWTKEGAYWQITEGVARGTYDYSTKSYLITPLLTVAEGESMVFQARSIGSYVSVKIEMQKNKGDWQACKTVSSDELTKDFKLFEISGLEAADYKFRFVNDDYELDNFNGFTVNQNDPELAVYSDAMASERVTSPQSYDFGFVNKNTTAHYYIKNKGTGTLNVTAVTVTDANGVSAQMNGASSVSNKTDVLTLDINIDAATVGEKSGKVVVTTDGGDFEIGVRGFAYGDKYLVDFSADNAKFPAGWQTGEWTVEGGMAVAKGSLTTTRLIAEKGEKFYIEAIATSSSIYNTPSLSYAFSDGTTVSVADGISADIYKVIEIDAFQNIENADTTVVLTFNGQNVGIRHIYGLTAVIEPIMTVTAADMDFGMQTAESEEQTFTISNEGTTELTGLTVTLAKTGDNAEYEVTVTGAEGGKLAVGATATVAVKQLFNLTRLGKKSDVLTIAADGQTAVTINLSGSTRDGSKLYVDFEDGGFPEGWNAGTSWSVYTFGSNNYAQQSNFQTESSLLTTPLAVAAGETLTFQAARYYAKDAPVLKIRYSTDGTVTWSEYKDYSAQITSTDFTTLTLTGVPAGTAVVEFCGREVKIDDIMGFKATTAPLIALTEGGETVATGTVKEWGNLTQKKTENYVIANTGNADLVSRIEASGIEAVITSEVEDAVNGLTVTLKPGETASITVTMPFEAPFGEKNGSLVITSNDPVAPVQISYTATLVDPNALYVDFADNKKPAGWYTSAWTFTNGDARNTSFNTVADLITEQFEADNENKVLTFDAWFTTTSEFAKKSLTVYTSADRKNWSEGKTFELTSEPQSVSLDALAAGKYYVKFEGTSVAVDNIAGLKKTEAPAHDLYLDEAKNELPDDVVIPGREYTAKVTVASLRADETVAAELWFDDNKVAELTEQLIEQDTYQTFTLTGNVPETEATYDVQVKVYNADVAVATAAQAVTVQHTRTLAVQAFSRVMAEEEPEMLVADDNNKITATFSVKVKNTGSVAVTPTVKVMQGETVVGELTATELLDVEAENTYEVVAAGISAGEGGSMSFTAAACLGETEFAYSGTVTINVKAAAPKFELADANGESMTDGAAVEFGNTKAQVEKTFTVTNMGNAPLVLKSVTASEGFAVTELTGEQKTIAAGETLNVTVTLLYGAGKFGKKQGDVTFTYVVDAQNDNTFTLAVSGRTLAQDCWVADFEDGVVPANWSNTIRWSVSNNQLYYSYKFEEGSIFTPRLKAEKDEELTFELKQGSVKLEYSTDKTEWTEYGSYETAGEYTFKAAREYEGIYLRFTTTLAYLDNFIGFRLNALDHDTEIAQSDIPATGSQYAPYTATVTVRENTGKSEAVTAKLYVGSEVMATVDGEVAANSTATLTLTYTPETVVEEAVAYVEVTYAGGTLKTDGVALAINAALTLDETAAAELTSGSKPAVVFNRSYNIGWNTICLPFAASVADFGENVKAYEFTGYDDGKLQFKKVTELKASYPYLFYAPETVPASIVFRNVTIDDWAFYSKFNDAKFQGTYQPIAAPGLEGKWGVTAGGKIGKGSATAFILGYRAYFELPENTDAARLAIVLDEDGQTTVIRGITIADTQLNNAFDLKGQRVETLKKGGIYIVNGKKTVVR